MTADEARNEVTAGNAVVCDVCGEIVMRARDVSDECCTEDAPEIVDATYRLMGDGERLAKSGLAGGALRPRLPGGRVRALGGRTVSGHITLGIDQANRSGWSVIGEVDRLVTHGLATTCAKRFLAIEFASGYARAARLPLVAVLEDHSKVPLSAGTRHAQDRRGPVSRGTAQVLGMGDARGRWCELLDLHGIRYTTVAPKVWRRAVLGHKRVVKTDDAKRDAVVWVERMHRVQVSHDEAEAIAIAHWGAHAPEVAKLAAMRRRSPVLGGVK